VSLTKFHYFCAEMETARRVYIETYGCQMNVADTELVLGIMHGAGYEKTDTLADADVVFVNTCAVRENAEQRAFSRMVDFRKHKQSKPVLVVGVLGCMAERLRRRFLESDRSVDVVVGPDEYRMLPALVEGAMAGERGVAVRLSRVENYDDVVPLRTEGISAWIPIMRGCDKFCTFCVVPFTRGRERSRAFQGIVNEVRQLAERGFKEVTLLGQNVNSYRDGEKDFADLLTAVAEVDRTMRIRFTTSHPQDMSDKLIGVIATHANVCNYIHLPVQSGSDRILELMNRSYTADAYLALVERIRRMIAGVSLSTDIISGFPTETDEDHRQTIELIRAVGYDGAFTFKYSPRENTKAWKMGDSVPEQLKAERLNEIIEVQRAISLRKNKQEIGRTVEVLVEGQSRKSALEFCGRTGTNKMVIFPQNGFVAGRYIHVTIERANSATLFGRHAE